VLTLCASPRRLAVLAAAALAIPIAGCGSSDSASSGSTDPAKAIPASAPVYVEATVQPAGKQKADLEAALSKILRTDDPAGKITSMIDKGSHGQTFEQDVKPWLGDKAAFALTGVGAGKGLGVAVINSTDDAKAQDAIAGDKSYSQKRSYEGTDYRYDPSNNTAAAVTSGFVVAGDEAAVQQVIHVLTKGGDSLASNVDLQDARAKVGGRPGFLFVETATLLRDAIGAAGPALGSNQLSAVTGAFKKYRAFGVGISADAAAVRMDVASIGDGSGAGHGPGSSLPLDQAPGGSWLAFTQSDIGASLQSVLSSLGSTSDQITALETATGLNVKQDLLSWMGDAAVFVEGNSVPGLGGALVVQSTDPAKTRTAITKIRALLSQFNQRPGPAPAGASAGFTLHTSKGKPVLVGLAGSRFVIAYGNRAFHDATNPGSTLGSTAAFKNASSLLGADTKPNFFVNWQTVTRFITLAAHNSASFQKAKPYLDAFTAIIGGGSGDRSAQVAIGLK
jgi:hypothetical protein